ncbi:hypothetical protein ACWCXE_20025 [Streptomyces sp. NPDC001780]
MKINNTPVVRFELATKREQLPAGRVCGMEELDGGLVIRICPGHATTRLCDELNDRHAHMLGAEGRWGQTWDDDKPDRAADTPQGLGIAEVTWRVAQEGELPTGEVCLPLEAEARFVWVIRPGFGTHRFCAEMTEYLERLTGDGLWVQNWEQDPGT